MNKKKELLKDHLKELEQISKSSLNENQKELIKLNLEILKNNDKISIDDFEQIWRFLKQRVATGFVFDEAPEINNQSIAILEKDEKLSFSSSKMKDNLQNSLIIGENYDVLKNLIGVEREREREDSNFDLIYIDPPYNTQKTSDDGNNLTDDQITADKFIYRDKFSRTGWLNLLNERLKLARQLLKEDGVIFVSIDDNEQAYLKVLMDEIFGEENFVANMVWRKSAQGTHKDVEVDNLNTVNEYIVTYAKDKSKFKFDYVKHSQEKLDEIYKFRDKNFEKYGAYKLQPLVNSWNGAWYRSGQDYELEAPDGTNFKIWQNIDKPQSASYSWSKPTFDKAKNLGLIEFKKNKQDYWVVHKKEYQYAKFDTKEGVLKTVARGVPFTNMIVANQNNLESDIYTSEGARELNSIFNSKEFDYPKPVRLIKYLIKMLSSKKNIRVLDFFAGSGTTGQAVLELNKEDNGTRTFTLVTNNENNIGQNVTYERLYRINKGQGTKGQKDFEWIKKNEAFDTSLNVFWSKTYNTSLLNNDITNQELKDKFKKLLKEFGIYKNKSKVNDSVLKTLSSLRSYKEENEEK